ncbi:hypothetical protein SAMN04488109_2111 [Chryseolinea serpens]|uniref:Lipoprotein n=1 Tax=Chryseolinea serpens TaxID=947013 RepID=A0A1M5N5B7_9BACT|nr:hypothetical protein [Chryseolinea serpens]SHG84632.1 hypothetical protein SAMN04488109_2111 [Chryseolinea serpens]
MKTRLLLLLSVSVLLFACTEGEDRESPMWGIDFSDEAASGFAIGSVDKQNDGAKITYIAKAANLQHVKDDVYLLTYAFQSGDQLQLTITKKTADYNYHFPGTTTENQIIVAMFNGETLDLTDSDVSIQPRTEENKLYTVTNLHTTSTGDFNGTIGRVPLLK